MPPGRQVRFGPSHRLRGIRPAGDGEPTDAPAKGTFDVREAGCLTADAHSPIPQVQRQGEGDHRSRKLANACGHCPQKRRDPVDAAGRRIVVKPLRIAEVLESNGEPNAAPHTVSSDAARWKFSKQLAKNRTVSFTFKRAGTYKYHCQYHAGMTGTIIVKK